MSEVARLVARGAAAARRRRELAVVAILIAGAALRFATLGSQSFDHDETVTAARVLSGGFGHAMAVVVAGERSPPLYYAVAWVWSRAFGLGEVGLRSLSALLGTATIAFAYLAGRELASKRAGLVAGLAVALDPYLIWYSQEARSYALLIAASAAALFLFARALREPTRRSLAGWAIACAIALCSHYFAVFAIVPEAAILLYAQRLRRPVVIAAVAVACAGAALVPLAVVQEGTGRGNAFRASPVAERAATAAVKYFTTEGPAPQGGISSTTPFERGAGAAGLALVGIGIAVGLRARDRRARRATALAATVGLGAFALPVLLAWAGVDYIDPRNMAAALVPTLVAGAVGFTAGRRAWLAVAGPVAASALFVVALRVAATTPRLQRNDWRAGVAAAPALRGARLYVTPADGRTPVSYYMEEPLVQFRGHRFADGIATRTIVVMSESPRIRRPAPGFREVATRLAPQHWTVRTYRAARPVSLRPRELARRDLLPREPWTVLAAEPRQLRLLEARADRRAAA